MDRIPFGIQRLDRLMDGGAPAGSVVLCSGEAGAGARTFVQTTAIMTALARSDPETYELYYGEVGAEASIPESVEYLSFTSSPEQINWEIAQLVDPAVEAAFEDVVVHDFATQYFGPSPIPRDWYGETARSIADLTTGDRDELLGAVGRLLSAEAPGSTVVIDSLSDLVGAPDETVEWDDVVVTMRALARAARDWGSLVLVHVDRDTLAPTQHGRLVDAATGALEFAWESAGNDRTRTMVVRSFRGVLDDIEAEDIVRFETEITDTGFDISDVRKIR